MLLICNKGPKVKCKVAKFIRLPRVSPDDDYKPTPVEFYQFYNIYLYRLYLKKYSTIFYINTNTIYFYNNKNTHVSRMIPIYNYKNGKINIISAGRKQSNIVWGSWRCVKAPNGNLYAVYIKQVEKYTREVIVHNLSKGKVIHKVEYYYDELVNKMEVDKYVHILLNSFVVICRVKDSVFHLHVVDLITEAVDTFTYTPYDYMNNLLEVIGLEEEKEHIRDILSSFYFLLMPSWGTLQMHENIRPTISLLNDDVPFVKYLELVLNINSCEEHESIDRALVVAFKYENNELEIRFSTGENVVIIKKPKKTSSATTSSHVVKPPSNYILFSKKYKLDSSYDISKSHPYYIHKVSKNCIFCSDAVFENLVSDKNDYTIKERQLKLIYIKGMTIFQSKTGLFANLERYYRNQDSSIKLYAIDENYKKSDVVVLDLNKIYTRLLEAKKVNEHKADNFVDISNYLVKFNVEDKIANILHKKYKNFADINIDNYKYHYYLDKYNGILFILVIISRIDNSTDNKEFDFYVFECDVNKMGLPCRIVMSSVSYDDKIPYKKPINYSSNINILRNTAWYKIHFLEIFKRINYNSMKNRIYICDNEIMLLNDVFVIKANDIKYNRHVIFNYVPNNIKDMPNIMLYYVFDYNVVSPLTIFTDDDGEDKRFRYLVILSSVELIMSMDLPR